MGFTIFGTEIRWYGVTIAMAILVAFSICLYLFKKVGYKESTAFEILLVTVPISIVGARLFFIMFEGGNFFAFRSGGMVIYGGIIFAAVALFLYTKFARKIGYFTVTDIIVIGLILAQAIGRWGNFFNIQGGYYEGYGIATNGPHIPPFTSIVRGEPHLSMWFLESLFNLIGFMVLLRIFTRQKKFGTTTASYMIWYGVLRTILEALRGDALYIGANDIFISRISVLISLGLVIAGCVILFINHKYPRFINQSNDNIVETEEDIKKKEESKQKRLERKAEKRAGVKGKESEPEPK